MYSIHTLSAFTCGTFLCSIIVIAIIWLLYTANTLSLVRPFICNSHALSLSRLVVGCEFCATRDLNSQQMITIIANWWRICLRPAFSALPQHSDMFYCCCSLALPFHRKYVCMQYGRYFIVNKIR